LAKSSCDHRHFGEIFADIKHWYVPSIRISLFQTSVFFFNGENWPILHQKLKNIKSSQQHGSRKRFGKFPKKLPHFEGKTFFNSSRFLEDLGRFVAIFY
jgi:hypothetical protein